MTADAQIAPAPAIEAPRAAPRRRGRGRRARQAAWNLVGLVVLVLMAFPVFWMLSTAFKPDDQINSLTPTWSFVRA